MRSLDEVSSRLLCLAAVVTRANTEELLGSNLSAPLLAELTGVDTPDVPAKVNEWLLREGLAQGLSAQERTWMKIPLGRWRERDVLDAWWRREGLMVLLWSTRNIDLLPDADEQLDLDDMLR
jgi:hypothetical protein